MTRIIAGKFRGRKLSVPQGESIRPTSDRMRERVFSMLAHSRYPDLYGARIADLYAGTGAMGLEALSRGAAEVTFVEKSLNSIKCLQGNMQTLDIADVTTVLKTKATTLPKAKTPFDILFMDPPYNKDLVTPTLAHILMQGWVSADSIIVCEMAADDESDVSEGFEVFDERKQGKQRMLFLKPV